MELPIIDNSQTYPAERIVRIIKQAASEITGAHSMETSLACGRAFTCPDRPNIYIANMLYDLNRPEDMTPAQVLSEIESLYQSQGVYCYSIIPALDDVDGDLSDALKDAGYITNEMLVMQMGAATVSADIRKDLQIVSARDVLPDFSKLIRDTFAHKWGCSAADDMAACHVDSLDNTSLDMLVARLDRIAVACAGIFSLAEFGVIWEVQTHPDYREQGIMKSLMSSVLDLAARCQCKAVILETELYNEPAIQLYESIGMKSLTTYKLYQRHSEA